MISQLSKNGYKNVANANVCAVFYHTKVLTIALFVPIGIASLWHIGFTRELRLLNAN